MYCENTWRILITWTRNFATPSNHVIDLFSSGGLFSHFGKIDILERIIRFFYLIQKQRGRKYRTKHFPCCNLFILYLLRFSPSTRFSPFIRQNKSQDMFLFRLSASTLSLLQNPSVNTFLYRKFTSTSGNASAARICFRCLAFLGFWSSLRSAVNGFI